MNSLKNWCYLLDILLVFLPLPGFLLIYVHSSSWFCRHHGSFQIAVFCFCTLYKIDVLEHFIDVCRFQGWPFPVFTLIHLYSDLQADMLICGFIYQDDSLVPNPSMCTNEYLGVLPVTLPRIIALVSLLGSLTGEFLHQTSRRFC